MGEVTTESQGFVSKAPTGNTGRGDMTNHGHPYHPHHHHHQGPGRRMGGENHQSPLNRRSLPTTPTMNTPMTPSVSTIMTGKSTQPKPTAQTNSRPSSPPPPASKTSGSHIGEDGAWNVSQLKEESFEDLAVYLVPDIPTSPDEPNRAEASLPRNLCLKPSAVLSDVRILNFDFIFFLENEFPSGYTNS